MNQEKIGKFIAECRKNKKMTQLELAEKLGVTDKSVGNWENARCMPDLSLFKPLCEVLDITINELLSGEKISKDDYQKKLEENIISTIEYTSNKLVRKNNYIGLLLIIFGVLIATTAIAIFPSESSWGGIYSVLGVMISLIGVGKFTKKLTYWKRLICNTSYFIIVLLVLILIDYVGVINIKQAPRFSVIKVSAEDYVYYDTLFYDVIRCNKNTKKESYKVLKNTKYQTTDLSTLCR